ncbi:MAG: hypothetical protein Aureis2KO_01090 [Aureisphaera sp.]
MAFKGEKDFLKGLKGNANQKKAIEALFQDPDFKKIWDYLKNCKKIFELKIKPGLTTRNKERFGGYVDGDPGELYMNPTKPEHKQNPMELADTLLHESMHAVFDSMEVCGPKGYPLPKGAIELQKDTKITGWKSRSKAWASPLDQDYLKKHYGDSPSNPEEEYIDINDVAQRFIIKIIKRLIKKTKVGKKTTTFIIEEKRKGK